MRQQCKCLIWEINPIVDKAVVVHYLHHTEDITKGIFSLYAPSDKIPQINEPKNYAFCATKQFYIFEYNIFERRCCSKESESNDDEVVMNQFVTDLARKCIHFCAALVQHQKTLYKKEIQFLRLENFPTEIKFKFTTFSHGQQS